MNKGELKKAAIIFVVIFVVALLKDLLGGDIKEEMYIERDAAGGIEKTLGLVAEIDGIENHHTYNLTVLPKAVTIDEAIYYVEETKKEIDQDFLEIRSQLLIQESYMSDLVEAEWSFSTPEYVTKDGSIVLENIPKEGVLVYASVLLSCGEYEEIYAFPFQIERTIISEEEWLWIDLEKELRKQLEQKDVDIKLPTTIDGKEIKWSEKREYLSIKILFLEIAAVVCIYIANRKKKEQESQTRRQEIELSYSDVVNQLAILLRAGMTMRQAWNRIAIQYGEKKSDISKAICQLNMKLKEGEKEKVAYEQFAEDVDVICYRRLMRIFINNLEKGTKDICNYLEEESQKAYEERILLAKKMGEEASTKMLIPLMFMMVLVMAIVLIPAVVSFTV